MRHNEHPPGSHIHIPLKKYPDLNMQNSTWTWQNNIQENPRYVNPANISDYSNNVFRSQFENKKFQGFGYGHSRQNNTASNYQLPFTKNQDISNYFDNFSTNKIPSQPYNHNFNTPQTYEPFEYKSSLNYIDQSANQLYPQVVDYEKRIENNDKPTRDNQSQQRRSYSHFNMQRQSYIDSTEKDYDEDTLSRENPLYNKLHFNSNNDTSLDLDFVVKHIEGDGDCFFTAVADELIRLLQCEYCFVNHIRSIFGERFEQGNVAQKIRELSVKEWRKHADYYKAFLKENVDFQKECQRFLDPGYYQSALGDLAPLTVANIFYVNLSIRTSDVNLPMIKISPSMISQHVSIEYKANPCVLNLYYTMDGGGHYDVAIPQIFRIPIQTF